MMAIESANIPLPSEAIMPAAGILVQQGKLNLHLAALAGAVGCLVGSVPSYLLGFYGGRPFLERHGRWLLLKERDMAMAESWVNKYGDVTFFIGRMLPIVRTFIGSFVWCYFLTFVGIKFG